jgi:TolB protein
MYVMNADGSGQVQISPDSVFDTSPTWSPDGQQLAVLRSTDGGANYNIYIINADGSGVHAITSDGGLKRWLRWTPE